MSASRGPASSGIACACLVLLAGSVASAAKIPESWGTCKRTLPQAELNSCLKTASQKALSELAGGYKPFGVFPMDPFKISAIRMEQGGGGSIAINMNFTDGEMIGLKDTQFQNIRADLKSNTFTLDMTVKKLQLKSKYVVKGKLLITPVEGRGKCTVDMEEPTMRLDLQCSQVKGKDGKSHLRVDNSKFTIVPKNSRFDFVNPDRRQQAALMSRVVTDNNQVVMADLQPAISDAFATAFADAASRIFNKVPYDDLFPEK